MGLECGGGEGEEEGEGEEIAMRVQSEGDGGGRVGCRGGLGDEGRGEEREDDGGKTRVGTVVCWR